jgi:DNA-binding NarL/FixJ family response regulator
MGLVPEIAAVSAERRRRRREAARRAEAANALRVGEAVCAYARQQLLAGGLSPEEARTLALETAAALAQLADSLRTLTRLGIAERRALARSLANLGTPTKQIAQQLGTCDRTVRYYVAGRQG